MGFGKHKHTGLDKTISGGGGYEGIYFSHFSLPSTFKVKIEKGLIYAHFEIKVLYESPDHV